MEQPKSRVVMPLILGAILISTGVVFLLNNFNIITLDWEFLMGPLFGMGGLIFLLVFMVNTDDWWALIPATALISLGVIIFLGQSDFESNWVGGMFLGMLGMSFWLIYAFHPVQWWAIIPGGSLFTLAAVSVLPEESAFAGSGFFLGLAVTFGLVYLLPNPIGRKKWALFPAGIMLTLGMMILLDSTRFINFVWPVALFLAGIALLIHAFKK
jgi:hypothetical protein